MLIDLIFSQIGEDYTPSKSNIFIIFQKPKELIKFVIIGQDPYPQKGEATGRSFERELLIWDNVNESLQAILCSIHFNTHKEFIDFQDVLVKISKSDFLVLPPNVLFKNWESVKGVFLLNTSLTTKTGNKNAHRDIWMPFTKKIIAELTNHSEITWFLWGNEAQNLEPYINSNNIFKSTHPAYFSYITNSDSSKKVLNEFCNKSGINKILNFNN